MLGGSREGLGLEYLACREWIGSHFGLWNLDLVLWSHDGIHIREGLKLSASSASSAPDIFLSSPDRASKGTQNTRFCPSSPMARLHVYSTCLGLSFCIFKVKIIMEGRTSLMKQEV